MVALVEDFAEQREACAPYSYLVTFIERLWVLAVVSYKHQSALLARLQNIYEVSSLVGCA